MAVHTKLSKDDSAKALEAATAAHAAAQAREASVDTRQAEAAAALQAALDEQALLSGRIAKGGAVKASEAGAAAALIVQTREHLSLISGAKEIASADVAASEREFLDAQYSHELHVIRAKRLALAGKQRAMAQKALDYAQSIEDCRDAGESMLISQRDALARRKHAPVGFYGGEFDQSLTHARFLVRSLPDWLLQIVREVPLSNFDYFAEADRQDKEATL
jgi:hypothetical protein